MSEILLNILSVVVTSIVVPLVSYAGLKLSEYLKAKTESEKIGVYIANATNAVKMAVLETTQVYVDELKKNGNFDAEAQKSAFARSLSTARSLITKEAEDAVIAVYGDFEAWLKTQIECQTKITK